MSQTRVFRAAVIVFPGSNCDRDCLHALEETIEDVEAVSVWHTPAPDLSAFNCLILPGGFSYGDYLRAGALARFAPVMQEVIRHAEAGMPVLGICNGFQILTEAGLLPGALLPNEHLKFRCEDVPLVVENVRTPFTSGYQQKEQVVFPIAHGQGRYVCDETTLQELESEGRVVLRYAGENPNGSLNNIAGICNKEGNVVGMMPHPERAVDPLSGLVDGRRLFTSILAERRKQYA